MDSDLILQDQQLQRIEFGTFRNPEVAMKEAELVAKTFAQRAEKLQLYKKIGDSKHLLVEGWQMLGSLYRVTASVRMTEYLEMGEVHGYQATADAIYIPTGRVISSADGMCLSDEDKWGPRAKYEWQNGNKTLVGYVPTPLQQLRSMAQTRSCSKVLSNLLKWVARMGGFAGTPAEEMSDPDQQQGTSGPRSQPKPKDASNGGGGPSTITGKQGSRIWGLAHSCNKSKEEVVAILKHFGFERAEDVTTDKYDAICAEIQKGDAQ